MNPFLATDGYKTGHHLMYPQGTSLVYSNFTPRSNRHANGIENVVSFGQQMVMRQIHQMFEREFFGAERDVVCQEIKREYSLYLNTDYDVSHIEALWELGYLPLNVKALPEGVEVPMGIPVLTIYNTIPEFYWLTNFLETLISNLLWKPMTSAAIGHQYKKNLLKWAQKTDKDNLAFVEFQGHDFSMRGLSGVDSVIQSGLGHALSFSGSDSLPVIHGARKYYDEENFIVGSVNATEHSVMSAGGAGGSTEEIDGVLVDETYDELDTFRYLMAQFPTGILSIVSDTWNLWRVITKFLPILKEEILERDGKIVIRPDSGDPVDIICGKVDKSFKSIGDIGEFVSEVYWEEIKGTQYFTYNNKTYSVNRDRLVEFVGDYGNDQAFDYGNATIEDIVSGGRFSQIEREELMIEESKGVVELLWDEFGGTINEQGYKVLDSHIGCIYGDSITLDRANDICNRLEKKGFASTNVVLGIGSFTYQFNTRDTFGFAMKATYVEITSKKMDGHGMVEARNIFKDPITDDGSKKSAKGLLQVIYNSEENYIDLEDQVTWEQEKGGVLKNIYLDGKFNNITTLTNTREVLKQFI